jgi:hypothetical protein
MKKDPQIAKNIKWFSKFGLLKKLELSRSQQQAIKILRRLKIEGIKKPD